jgi:hypothetical protein
MTPSTPTVLLTSKNPVKAPGDGTTSVLLAKNQAPQKLFSLYLPEVHA